MLTGVMAAEALQSNQDEMKKNLEAESAYVRQKIWGEKPDDAEEEEMSNKQVVLGDLTTTNNTYQQKSGSGIGKVILGAALASGIVGGPVVGYLASQFLNKSDTPVVQPVKPVKPVKPINDTDNVIEWTLE